MIIDDAEKHGLKQFYDEFIETNNKEVNFFMDTLEKIGRIGIKDGFFEDQGGNSIYRLKNIPTNKKDKPQLRLYCIKWGSMCLIIGGGGKKPDDKRAWQEAPELRRINELLSKIDNYLYENNLNIDAACQNNTTFEIED